MMIHQVYNWVKVVQEKRCFVVFFWLRRGYKKGHIDGLLSTTLM